MLPALHKLLKFSLILPFLCIGFAVHAERDVDQEQDSHEESLLPLDSSCFRALTKSKSTDAYFRARLPTPKIHEFSKENLATLFKIKERAGNDPKKLAKIESREEQALLSAILDRKVSIGEVFGLQEITDKLMIGAFYRLAFKFARNQMGVYSGFDFDDVLQAAVAALHQSILIYDYHSKYMFPTWAQAVMKKTFDQVFASQIAYWQALAPNPPAEDETADENMVSGEELIGSAMTRARIARGMTLLTPQELMVFRNFFGIDLNEVREGDWTVVFSGVEYSIEEIAEMSKLPPARVRQNRDKALRKIRAQIAKLDDPKK